MNRTKLEEEYFGKIVQSCRMCASGSLYPFLDLGHTPPADEFRSEKDLNNFIGYYPLKVLVCDDCGLVQLSYVVNPEVLYQNDYPYESSITSTGRTHWREFAGSVVSEYKLKQQSLVVDIGSNVGVLLAAFKQLGMSVQGIDPAQGIVDIANNQGINTRCSFFDEKTVAEIVKENGRASVVTATNVVAHVDNLDIFIRALDSLLDEDGVFIFEAPYLVDLLENLEYDTIYHEHLSYLSVRPMLRFFEKFNFEIIDIEEQKIHGGSIRVVVSRKDKYKNTGKANLYADRETSLGIYKHDYLDDFAARVYENKQVLRDLLYQLKGKGKKIAAVSAPAKGMTLLNYCRIGREQLDFVTEKSTLKKNKFTPGSHLKVMEDDDLVKNQIDYALLLAWNFSDEIMKNLEEYRAAGGKFIIPIPDPKIVSAE